MGDRARLEWELEWLEKMKTGESHHAWSRLWASGSWCMSTIQEPAILGHGRMEDRIGAVAW